MRGGYESAKVPRSEMKPPPASAIKTKRDPLWPYETKTWLKLSDQAEMRAFDRTNVYGGAQNVDYRTGVEEGVQAAFEILRDRLG